MKIKNVTRIFYKSGQTCDTENNGGIGSGLFLRLQGRRGGVIGVLSET
jgi:hypothetical protein